MLEFKDILKQKNVRMDTEAPLPSDPEPETETEPTFASKAGLPDMNITFEYDHSMNNSIALITKAVMYNNILTLNDTEDPLLDEERAIILDILYNPGYAPMERLAKAFAFIRNNIDPYNIPEEDKSNYAVDFANDLERIAFAICPDMFAKLSDDEEFGGELEPAEPVEDNNV